MMASKIKSLYSIKITGFSVVVVVVVLLWFLLLVLVLLLAGRLVVLLGGFSVTVKFCATVIDVGGLGVVVVVVVVVVDGVVVVVVVVVDGVVETIAIRGADEDSFLSSTGLEGGCCVVAEVAELSEILSKLMS